MANFRKIFAIMFTFDVRLLLDSQTLWPGRASSPRSVAELPNQLDGFVIAHAKLTPNGGAVAIGHPFGAIGARCVLTLATELRERNARYGAIDVCVGSGQGVAIVIENHSAD